MVFCQLQVWRWYTLNVLKCTMFQFNPLRSVINYMENIWEVADHPFHFAPLRWSLFTPSIFLGSNRLPNCCARENIYPGYRDCLYIKLKLSYFLSWNCRPATWRPKTSLFSGIPSPTPPAALFSQDWGQRGGPKVTARENQYEYPAITPGQWEIVGAYRQENKDCPKSSPAISVTQPFRVD